MKYWHYVFWVWFIHSVQDYVLQSKTERMSIIFSFVSEAIKYIVSYLSSNKDYQVIYNFKV